MPLNKIARFGLTACILLIITASFISFHTVDENHLQEKSAKGFAVIELFTSEGCSSCPPADRFVEELQQKDITGNLFIMVYHVDYWDRLGWKDRFSEHQYTVRQNEYASKMHLTSVYTPQIIINGQTQYIGANRSAVMEGITTQMNKTGNPSLQLKYAINKNRLTVSHNMPTDESSELQFALVQERAESNVRSGENSGKHLSHVQIVRSLQSGPVEAEKTAVIALPKDFAEKGWQLICFVQHRSTGEIINASKIKW